jgi:hypothetical protein
MVSVLKSEQFPSLELQAIDHMKGQIQTVIQENGGPTQHTFWQEKLIELCLKCQCLTFKVEHIYFHDE